MDKWIAQGWFDELRVGGINAFLAIITLPIWFLDEVCDLILYNAGIKPGLD